MTLALGGPTTLSSARIRFALLALALGGFAIGSTEFVAMGLLPDIAQALFPHAYAVNSEDANAHTGLIISAYALGVVVGAPTIAATTSHLPRKQLLLALEIAFVLGTVFAALSPNFSTLLIARFICGLPHGAYFGIASLVAADLMGEGKRGRGVAMVMTGLTVANTIGVPAITWIGQIAGWRVAYGVVAALFGLTFLAIATLLPWQPGDSGQTVKKELSAFKKGQVWFALGIGAIGFGGFFALYTYIAPIVTDVAHLPQFMVPIALVVCGLGMTVGNIIGGRMADWNVPRTIAIFFVFVMVALAFTALVAHNGVLLIIAIFFIGVSSSGIAPAVQTRLMDVAHESQAIAAALNHSAFNMGNSLGAFLGGVVVTAGLGYLAPAWIGIVLSMAGLIIAMVSFGVERRGRRLRTAGAQTA